jgi:steroid 5-alpha-reductase/3-oxo-5-alpha-steroid 4-dehydrogenase 1
MVVAVPILSDFLELLTPKYEVFDHLLQVCLCISIAMLVFVIFYQIPYGKSYTKGQARLKVELRDRVSVIGVNLPGLIVFAYAQLYYPNGRLLDIPSLLFIGHYVHRALVYPWFRKPQSKVWPLESFLYYLVSNFMLATIAARGVIFGGVRPPIIVQLPLAAGFIACAVGAGLHDYKLCALRKAGDTGYQVPHGLLFKWLSGPNYALELVQWALYLPFLPTGFLMATFAIWLMANITGRAEAVHDAYTKKLFKNKYPEDRCPYIPFVKNSRWLI